ncbi:hypothetical protein ACGF5F_35155 [Streptomyces sp. NPDC047821]|uniref:hypothetical protein n=1 Tax=Streptomyces sp. NPDC047821 TaxID=3365488 RepID=UPI003711FCB2
MLPTEPPLSLHRLLAPVPPARAQDTATATRHSPPATTPAPVSVQVVPVLMSNALTARAAHAKPPIHGGPMLTAAQDQAGNAAVAKAVTQAAGAAPHVPMVPLTTRRKDTPGR